MIFYFLNLFIGFFAVFTFFAFRNETYTRKRMLDFEPTDTEWNSTRFWNYSRFRHRIHYPLLIVTAIHLILAVFFGYLKIMKLPITIVSVILYLVQLPAILSEYIYCDLEEFGRPFVLYQRRRADNSPYSSLFYYRDILYRTLWTACNILDLIVNQ